MFKLKYILFFSLIILLCCNTYKIDFMREITYSQLGDNDRMITFYWENFGIKSDEVINQVVFEISTKKIKIGNWQGEFGTSLMYEPYWYHSDTIIQSLNDSEGTIVWNIPEDIKDKIKAKYDGIFKFGIWWIDCDSFTLKSITIITS